MDEFDEILAEFREAVDETLIEIWIETAAEFDIEYVWENDELVLKDEEAAMLRQFGSGTQGVAAEFWYEQVMEAFKKKVRNMI